MAKKKKTIKKPIVFIILDGWGIKEKSGDNAISLAKTPMMDYFYQKYPNTTLQASGKAVGLPKEQAGNSEAGHLNIGAGRVVKQDLVDINEQIKTGKFKKNPALVETIHYLEENKKANIHIAGLLSGDQSSHTYPEHIYALIDFYHSQGITNIYLHLFSDGRDAGPYEGVELVEKLIRQCPGCETVTTLIGRFYAMDRAENWKRTEQAYRLMTEGKADQVAHDPISAFTKNYNQGFSDEFIPPTVIDNPEFPPEFIKDNDVVIFFNCRSDRARQLVKPFIQDDFEKQGGFKRKKKLKNLKVVTFTDFAEELDHVNVAFPSVVLENTLPCALADNGLSQMYIAEEEKYAHMTYFLNGGVAKTRCGEKRLKFDSFTGKNFADNPEMATPKIVDKIVQLLKNKEYDFIAANFANADMLGHTGDISATMKGIEVIDKQLEKIYKEVEKQNGLLVITADHGNAEDMRKGNEVETHHNKNNVPFFIIDPSRKGGYLEFKKNGKLAHVVPTMFDVANLKKPKGMTTSLIQYDGKK